MIPPKTILIIAYVFPPYPGIGGRRWAKFAKYLVKEGYEVYVICAENPFKEESQWTKDILLSGITIHKIPSSYSKWLLINPKNIIEKLLYRFNLLIYKMIIKGNYYDKSALWGKQLLKKSEEIIDKHQVKNIIVTGAPFHSCYIATKLKNTYKSINLITDIRDPWSQDLTISGFSSLEKARQEVEIKHEREVVNHTDVLVTVADEMTNYFKGISTNSDTCFTTLLNGYDVDDIPTIEGRKELKDEKLKFVYTGTLYNKIDSIFFPFIDALAELKNENSTDYYKLSFDFYGFVQDKFINYIKEKGIDIITCHGKVPLPIALKSIAKADLCLLFLADAFEFSFSTKYYEYIAQRKKIVAFSRPGTLTKYIEKNEIGYGVYPDSIKGSLKKILSEYKSDNHLFPSNFDIKQFSCESLTGKFIQLLK